MRFEQLKTQSCDTLRQYELRAIYIYALLELIETRVIQYEYTSLTETRRNPYVVVNRHPSSEESVLESIKRSAQIELNGLLDSLDCWRCSYNFS